MTPSRLKIYAGDLADIERGQLEVAFSRARRELKFFPRIAELRELAGQGEKQKADADMRAAWDVLQRFVSKYVSNDVYGNFGPEFGWYSNYPELSDRILDTVRRTGGWKVYKTMDSEDMPFVQKRFFEEYEACKAVDHIALDRMLIAQERPALTAPKREQELVHAKPIEGDRIAHVVLKSVPGRMTEAQIRERREVLRQQTQFCRTKRSATAQADGSSLAR